MKKLKRVLALVGIAVLLSQPAHAATPRYNWVVNEIYSWNHPLAATDSADLATKMQTMSASPWLFYRGTSDIFSRDMATLPASAYTSGTTAYTWLQGDSHLGNFGAWRDSSGNFAFAVNDADEGYLGQYVWDLRRFVAAAVLAGRENGLADADIRPGLNTFIAEYVSQISTFAGGTGEKSFLLTTANTTGVVDDLISAAKNDTRSALLSKYTTVSGGVRKFQSSAELVTPSASTYSAIQAAIPAYTATIAAAKRYAASYYAVKDIRQKLGSGVGSLGKLRYFILLEGPTTATSDDVVIEMKQATVSAVSLAAPGQLSSGAYGSHEGNRIARTAKAQLQNADVLVGYASVGTLRYYVHERSPYDEGFDYTQLSSAGKFNTAMAYFGRALASAHALADQDYDAAVVPYDIDTAIKSADKTTGLQTELGAFAFSYADQVRLDWQSFVSAYNANIELY
ncbi:MAG: DUF2252 domain-containing protein [Nevskia sp.]|nr:DUF2252 domain-containing protein [Nevskia sp.]MCK9386655.1 DUF2252 domain-containing protein [Nevskia sp.]